MDPIEKTHLVVIYSCRQYERSRMKWQSETWPKRIPPQMALLPMTGGGDNEIDDKGVLRLSVEDGYMELIDKTQSLFDWFLAKRTEPWLVKCDDDVWLSPSALEKIVDNNEPYAGAYAFVNYAGGPLYVLHRDAIAKLRPLREYVIDDNVAEDLAVGRAATAAGIPPALLGFNQVMWYHHENHELSGQHAYDMIFCFTRTNHKEVMEYAEVRYKAH